MQTRAQLLEEIAMLTTELNITRIANNKLYSENENYKVTNSKLIAEINAQKILLESIDNSAQALAHYARLGYDTLRVRR